MGNSTGNITIRMDLSLKNATIFSWLLVMTSCSDIGLVAFDEGFSNQVILGVRAYLYPR